MIAKSAAKGGPVPVPFHSDTGSGDRVIVFLHGIGGNHSNFDDQMSALSDDWRALSWDMPGYGKSVLDREMTFPFLADSLLALFDAAGAAKAVVCGHSMGGMVAQEFAALFPERVEGLVLSATSPAFGSRDGQFQKEFLAARLAPLDRGLAPAEFADEMMAPMLSKDVGPAIRDRARASMAAVSANAYRAALHCIVTFDRRDNLARIPCPTLVLAAETDRLSSPAMMERMARGIPGAAYRCMPGVGHLANIEKPALFNAALTEFLDSIA